MLRPGGPADDAPVTPSEVLFGRRWLVLASAVVSFFAVGVTFFAVPPLVPGLIGRFALSHLQIGLLMGAIAVPAIFFSIPLGAAVDRWPARAAGNTGLGLMVLGAALFALAPSYALLLLGRLLFGVGGLVVNLLLARLISTAFRGRQLALAMGIFMSVYPAAMIVVYSLHPRLEAVLGWRGELAVLALAALVAIPIHNLVVPPALRGTTGSDRTVGAGVPSSLLALGASWLLFFAVFASVLTFAPEWAGIGAHGLLTVTVVMWVSLIASPVAGALIDRAGHPEHWIAVAMIALSGVLLAMAFAGLPAIAAMLAVGCCASVIPTATYALPARLVPAERVGFAFGLVTALSNLGTVAGPSLTGWLRDATASWSPSWAILAGVALAGSAASFKVRSRTS
jgi:predicted MFS family arabinose efflux permease